MECTGFVKLCSVLMYGDTRLTAVFQPLQAITGETVDIVEYLDFGFYDQVWYHKNAGLGEPLPGCWLVISTHVEGKMCFYVLTQSGRVISHSTVW